MINRLRYITAACIISLSLLGVSTGFAALPAAEPEMSPDIAVTSGLNNTIFSLADDMVGPTPLELNRGDIHLTGPVKVFINGAPANITQSEIVFQDEERTIIHIDDLRFRLGEGTSAVSIEVPTNYGNVSGQIIMGADYTPLEFAILRDDADMLFRITDPDGVAGPASGIDKVVVKKINPDTQFLEVVSDDLPELYGDEFDKTYHLAGMEDKQDYLFKAYDKAGNFIYFTSAQTTPKNLLSKVKVDVKPYQGTAGPLANITCPVKFLILIFYDDKYEQRHEAQQKADRIKSIINRVPDNTYAEGVKYGLTRAFERVSRPVADMFDINRKDVDIKLVPVDSSLVTSPIHYIYFPPRGKYISYLALQIMPMEVFKATDAHWKDGYVTIVGVDRTINGYPHMCAFTKPELGAVFYQLNNDSSTLCLSAPSQNVLAHETLHALGLDHDIVNGELFLMAPGYNNASPDNFMIISDMQSKHVHLRGGCGEASAAFVKKFKNPGKNLMIKNVAGNHLAGGDQECEGTELFAPDVWCADGHPAFSIKGYYCGVKQDEIKQESEAKCHYAGGNQCQDGDACETDSDCGEGRICGVDGCCKDKCQDTLACQQDSDCAGSQYCDGNCCRERPEPVCQRDNTSSQCGGDCQDTNENCVDTRYGCRCQRPICGNNVLDPDEECDMDQTDQCQPDQVCTSDCKCADSVCGNKIREGNEECDPPGELCQKFTSDGTCLFAICNDVCKCPGSAVIPNPGDPF